MKAHQPESVHGSHEQDAQLFRSAKEGRKEDALLLFVRHARRFRIIVRRILARRLRNILDPDDLVQDIAIVLLSRRLPDWISTPADFTRYVGGVARNMALVQNRKHLDGRHHSLDHEIPLAAMSEYETPSSNESGASELLEDQETFTDLHDWLPFRMREIVMWVLMGYSVAEVASFFEIEEETVIMFMCTANNFRAHSERKIAKEEAMQFFKPTRRRPIGKHRSQA